MHQVPDEAIRQHQWSGLMEMLMKHVYARDIMLYLEQISTPVNHLVQSKADDYLFSMIKYLIEKSEIHDRDAFHKWVQSHLSPGDKIYGNITIAEQWKAEGRMEGALIGERRLLTTFWEKDLNGLP